MKLLDSLLEKLTVALNRRTLNTFTMGCLALGAVIFLVACTLAPQMRYWGWGLAGGIISLGIGARMIRPYIEARLLVKEAHRLIQAGHFRNALYAAHRAVELVPYLASAYLVRSAAYAGMGQIDMAVDDADQAVRVAPKRPEARLARARIYSYRGLHEDAIYDLRTGLRERPDWATGYMEMARLYVKLQDYANTLAILDTMNRHITSPRPRYDAMILAGWVYEDKLKDLDRAIASYTRAIPLQPDRKIGYLRRALAYRTRGDIEQYAEDLLRAANRRPTPEDAGQYYWLRAICYGRRFAVTGEARDLLAWGIALERSASEDAAQFAEQSRQWLHVLRNKLEPRFPPRIRFYLN